MNEEKYCLKGSSILQCPNKEETSRKKDFNKKLNCGLPREIAISSFGFCISNNLYIAKDSSLNPLSRGVNSYEILKPPLLPLIHSFEKLLKIGDLCNQITSI